MQNVNLDKIAVQVFYAVLFHFKTFASRAHCTVQKTNEQA